MNYPRNSIFLSVLFSLTLVSSGCTSSSALIAANAAEKNLDLSGYIMLGKLETANSTTATPTGKLLIGRVNYKSRLVAIDKNKKVPTTGSFRAIKTVSLFGTEETIIEYDFTAADAETAARICQTLQQTENAAKCDLQNNSGK